MTEKSRQWIRQCMTNNARVGDEVFITEGYPYPNWTGFTALDGIIVEDTGHVFKARVWNHFWPEGESKKWIMELHDNEYGNDETFVTWRKSPSFKVNARKA